MDNATTGSPANPTEDLRHLPANPKRDPALLRRSLLHNLRQLPNGRWAWKYDREGLLARDVAAMNARRVVSGLEFLA